MTAHLQYREF